MRTKPILVLLMMLTVIIHDHQLNARGRGGGGGGRMGGGGARPSFGGGGGNRPSFSGGGGRPNAGGGHPNIGGGSRPNVGGGNLGGGNRPNLGGGGGVNRPNFPSGNRPGGGFGENRPGVGNHPNLPGGNPFGGGGNHPGLGTGNRPNVGSGNFGNQFNNNHNFDNRFSNNNFNNININRNNFAVGQVNHWNNWHHGYWGGGYWGGTGWGLGYGAGYMHGYWAGYANRPWYSSVALYGLGAWALGSVYYDSGYAVYNNPYYVSNVAYYDYSQPIQVVAQPTPAIDDQSATPSASTSAPPPDAQANNPHVDKAREAFSIGNYTLAGQELDLALKDLPNDAAIHEFRALVDFATGDYRQAASTLYAVLSVGPGWDWTTMSSLYPSVDKYTEQLRALETYVKANPDAADARFVLAYHYITTTHNDAAIKQLQEVMRLQPNDQLTAQLIKGLGGQVSAQPGSAPPPAAEDPQVANENQPQPPDIDPAKIVGRRTAQRPDGTKFTLDLTADNKFTWAYERNGQKNQFGGTYTVDGAVLVLKRDDQATMPGLVTMEDNGFNFKLFGAPNGDPGLDFKN